MQGNLKRRYQIQKEVSRGSHFAGDISLQNLSRLTELTLFKQGQVKVEFDFGRSELEAPTVSGSIDAKLTTSCQRCLRPMELSMQFEFKLLVDALDELVAESSLDTVYSEEGEIDIFEVVEDELILGLPLVAMHADASCNEYIAALDESPEADSTENPFSVLAKLKTTN